MRKWLVLLAAVALLSGCISRNETALYVLVDVSGTYHRELPKAVRAVAYLLAKLRPGDAITLAKISSRSFSDREIVFRVRFPTRPSEANRIKRALKEKLDRFARTRASAYTDIRGAVLQAAEWLAETPAARKVLVIFSDLAEDLPKDVRRAGIKGNFAGIEVLAVDVIKLRSDNRDPARYTRRLARWRAFFTEGGAASFRVLADPMQLPEALGL